MVNWSKVFSSHVNAKNDLTEFATGKISGGEIQKRFSPNRIGECVGIRDFVRTRGVTEARRIARKALRRRGVAV